MKSSLILIAGFLILMMSGCPGTNNVISVTEDWDGNRVTTTVSPSGEVVKTKTKSNVASVNLHKVKIARLLQDLELKNKDNMNDYAGFKVYVKDFDNGNTSCYASMSQDNIDNVRLLFSRGQGIVEPAYNYKQYDHKGAKNDFVEMVPAFLVANKIISGYKNIGLNIYESDKTREYDKIFRKKLTDTIDERVKWQGKSAARAVDTMIKFSFYDKQLIDNLTDKIGKIDYIVMPNSEVPSAVIAYAIHTNFGITVGVQPDKRLMMIPNPDSEILYGVIIVSADTIRNMDNGNKTLKITGLYDVSLLTVGCTNRKAESIVKMMKYLKSELKLSGTQKSKAIGE